MPKMKGNPLTWGPDEEDRYLAGATCGDCSEQLLGDYVKVKPEKGMRPDEIAEASRQACIDNVKAAFEKQAC